jgi:hypothetical protein
MPYELCLAGPAFYSESECAECNATVRLGVVDIDLGSSSRPCCTTFLLHKIGVIEGQ